MKGIMRSLDAVCTNATVQDVSIDVWDNNVPVRWKLLAGIDANNAVTVVQVGWRRGREFYPFYGFPAGLAGYCYPVAIDVMLPGEFQPTARFYGATLGDMLSVYAAGEVDTGESGG